MHAPTSPRPRRTLRALALLLGALLVAAAPAGAQERAEIRFPPGASATTIGGTLTGDGYLDHVLEVRAGQTMRATLRVTATDGTGSAYFNVLPAGRDFGGLYTGSTDTDRTAEVTFPTGGAWALRTYLMGNDRDAGRTVRYEIDVALSPATDPAIPVARVTGVAERDWLNVRGGPGTGFRPAGALPNDAPVRILACDAVDGARWCRIEALEDGRVRGWVNARYLTAPAGTPPLRVRFAPGADAAVVEGTLAAGEARRFVLGARAGQELSVEVSGAGLSVRVLDPGGATLPDGAPSAPAHSARLQQSGDHVVEVLNAVGAPRSFSATLAIR